MNTSADKFLMTKKIVVIIIAVLFIGFAHSELHAFTLNVIDENGSPVSGFRWLLEEDTTYKVTPGALVPSTAEAEKVLSLSIGKSYAPVVDKGNSIFSNVSIDTNPAKRYYISVLPGGSYALGGAQVAANQTDVTVVVNSFPIPTAQISILVFNDNGPINNAPDLPGEVGLEGFDILLEDAAGTYGIGGGNVTQDAFGNPLGTTYNFDGSVSNMGAGILRTDADGRVLVQNLAPGKYGVVAVPPAGQNWVQTSTIEGKKVIDAWVKAGEPQFFQEFGGAGVHVFIGFIQPFINTAEFSGTHSISGTVVNLHNSRPPDFTFHGGTMTSDCWIGLNNLAVGLGLGIYAQPCDANSGFSIDNVPNGTYELAIWDANLGIIFAQLAITVQTGGCIVGGGVLNPTCELGNVPVFKWFGAMYNEIFYDEDEDGFKDPGDAGLLEQVVNLRFRNGSLYQSMPTDLAGTAPFEEVFPFFHWLVTEVDFTRFKETGATITVDGGGATGGGELNPQAQICTAWDVTVGTIAHMGTDGMPGGGDDTLCTLGASITNPNTNDNLSRTVTGEVLTQGFQVFLGETNKI